MIRLGPVVLVVLLVFTHLNDASAEDCNKCHCTSYPVKKGCENCCRLADAKTILDQVMMMPNQGIPEEIAAKATCVGVVPGLRKSAFVVGGQDGQGVVTCRTGHGWSAPVFIRVAGGSFGFQIGGQSSDLVLVAVNSTGFQDLLKNKFKIGVDASAAAGPVGRNAQASTDQKPSAPLLTQSILKSQQSRYKT